MRQLKFLTAAIAFALLPVMVVGCTGPSLTSAPVPKRTVSERLVAEIDYSSWIPDSIVVSPDNRRIAYLAQAGNKQCVVVDGQEGKQYDSVVDLIFSPNSRRVAYIAQSGHRRFVVVDGQEGNRYPMGKPVFSPDSQRLAYVAYEDNKQFLVVDGQGGKKYDKIEFPPPRPPISPPNFSLDGKPLLGSESRFAFSPDSRRLAYVAKLGDEWFMVVDGEEKQPGGSLIFSSDSQRIAYWGVGNKFFMVVDGQEGKQYDEIGLPTFSLDSKRVAYWARLGRGRCVAVVDGQEGKEYAFIGAYDPVFSPNSQRIAYGASLGADEWFMVVNGKEDRHFDHVYYVGTPAFSPDSKRVAYVATASRLGQRELLGFDSFVVMDGKRGNKHHQINDPVFSPDSQRVAYAARAGDSQFVVVDGKKGKKYDYISNPMFSPDSQHVAYVASVNNSQFVVVDGKEGKKYDKVLGRGEKIIFDSPNSLHYLVIRGNGVYLVEERIE